MNSLLKKERQGLLGSFGCWPQAFCGAAARLPQAFAHSAMGLIAAKPVKPCDGGVFWGLNLLLKTEREAPARVEPDWGAQPIRRLLVPLCVYA